MTALFTAVLDGAPTGGGTSEVSGGPAPHGTAQTNSANEGETNA